MRRSGKQAKNLKIKISRVNESAADLPLPAYATPQSSGMDLRAAEDAEIRPGETTMIPTGFRIAIPPGYEGQVRPRSGLAIKHAIGILNSPGTIDSDYRGEVKVLITNFGKQSFRVGRGDRIAQLVISPVTRSAWVEVPDVDRTDRGEGGFGHTGI